MESVWIAQNQGYDELYVFFSEEKLVEFLEQEAEKRNKDVFYVDRRYIVAKDREDDDPVVFAEEYYEYE